MTYLITLADIYSGTTIQSNVQASLLYPFMSKAQDLNLLKVLGTAQYDSLVADVAANGITGVTPDNASLLSVAKPMLVNYTWYYAMPFLTVRIDNKGVNKLTSENSDNAGDDKVIDLLTRISIFAGESERNLLKFLRKNYLNYPLWREDIYYTEDCGPYGRTYFGGIEFDLNSSDWIYINGKRYRRSDLL